MFAFHGIWTWVVAQQSIKFLPKFESLSSEIPLPRRNHSDSQVFKLRFNIWSFLSQNPKIFQKDMLELKVFIQVLHINSSFVLLTVQKF